MTRIHLATLFAATIATVACSGGSPASPSGTGAATITGTVVAAGSPATSVSVAGTQVASAIDSVGSFRLASVPTGNIQLVFSGPPPASTVSLSNVMDDEVIDLRVAISGGIATVQSELRGNGAGKIVLCHREGNGGYHAIDVSVNAESAHRGHGDARPGEPVPDDGSKIFDDNCRAVSLVRIEKFTNGQRVSQAPGPTVAVGSTVTWTYVVTNTSSVTFTGLSVTDDRELAVSCPSVTLAPGGSMTCSASRAAVAGQYRNVGTVVAIGNGNRYTAMDVSYYFGGTDEDDGGPKVQLCHRTGNGRYHSISVSINAERAHRSHGDGMVGEAVPGNPGRVFTASCGVQ